MDNDLKNKFKIDKNYSYAAKDFNAHKRNLLDYARNFFPNKVQDFNETSVAGMMLDMAAYVGDVMNFYLDHQFSELNPETAVEVQNVQSHLRNAGVEISGASPAILSVTFGFVVNAELVNGNYVPKASALPIIQKETRLNSTQGVVFSLMRDLDFGEKDPDGHLIADVVTNTTDANGNPVNFLIRRTGVCVSGEVKSETFAIGNTHVPFRKLTLSEKNVSEITSVVDSDSNEYYEVKSLTQDTVFKTYKNVRDDKFYSPEGLEIKMAPRRFVKKTSLVDRTVQIQFGSGDGLNFEDGILPDPSEMSLPLYGKDNFTFAYIDPNSLINSRTLGTSPRNTVITVTYRYGGGLNHNITAGSITSVQDLRIIFPGNPSLADADLVNNTVVATNLEKASGGSEALTIRELRSLVPGFRNAQSRIVTKEDLLARIYTLPSNLGRVYRAAVRPNANNPLASNLFIASLDNKGDLTTSNDTLKLNLSNYLNEFRLSNEAIDILDAKILNFKIKISVAAKASTFSELVSAEIITKLTKYFDIKFTQIEKPINLSDVSNIILNTQGVLSIESIKVESMSGQISGRQYGSSRFNPQLLTKKNIVNCPPGGIFDLKFPEFDIEVVVS